MRNFHGRDFLKITDYEKEEIYHIFEVADKFEEVYRKKTQLDMAKGKILANLFWQPSTRTRFSHVTAMLRLGGQVMGFAGAEMTATAKGETLEDTIRMIDSYANIIVQRHPEVGSADISAKIANIPVINGGDGNNRHPTQALLDLYTINKIYKRIKGVKVGLWGDLKFARVTNSLNLGLAMFNADIVHIFPEGLSPSEDIIREMKNKYGVIPQRMEPDEALRKVDVLYTTALTVQDIVLGTKGQLSENERKRITKDLKNFTLNLERLKNVGVKKELSIMHCLPRDPNELSEEIDNTNYCKYFDQAGYGVPVRMALIALLLGLVK